MEAGLRKEKKSQKEVRGMGEKGERKGKGRQDGEKGGRERAKREIGVSLEHLGRNIQKEEGRREKVMEKGGGGGRGREERKEEKRGGEEGEGEITNEDLDDSKDEKEKGGVEEGEEEEVREDKEEEIEIADDFRPEENRAKAVKIINDGSGFHP